MQVLGPLQRGGHEEQEGPVHAVNGGEVTPAAGTEPCFGFGSQLLCMQCRGIGPHLVVSGKSHGFSRVAAGTWGIFSSYDGDAHSKREFV